MPYYSTMWHSKIKKDHPNVLFTLPEIYFKNCKNLHLFGPFGFYKILRDIKQYGLFSFQYRYLSRMLNFAFKILNFDDGRIDLKNKLIPNEAKRQRNELRNKVLLFEPDLYL
ncbi:hypothetical protein BpHYR1_011583 [Brachionus plicatilis]|uniref:Uncharacterized protein n=1 Tax=Brachionus plicatilis TaxID=10195 RepID=A0A3M7P2Q4_BRAPC|nr:hypothetical protein BpHYR1_011583 [Brachionus plicatilis]